jgi:hypothetical protein
LDNETGRGNHINSKRDIGHWLMQTIRRYENVEDVPQIIDTDSEKLGTKYIIFGYPARVPNLVAGGRAILLT